MKKMNPLALLVMLALGICLGLAALPSVNFAQDDKGPKEKAREADDDDDDDENLTDADRRAVKLSLEEARKIALEKVPGTVIDEELEKEHGRLQYAFDIRTSEGKIYDVEISAVNGEIFQAEEDEDDDDSVSVKRSVKVKQVKVGARSTKVVKPKKTN